jgi:hypothetical protein
MGGVLRCVFAMKDRARRRGILHCEQNSGPNAHETPWAHGCMDLRTCERDHLPPRSGQLATLEGPTLVPEPKPSSGHADSERRLTRIAEAARAWDERCRAGMAVQPRSELAHDDARFPELKVSHLVSWSMTVAAEHLNFTTTAMRETETVYPTAYLTVLRTALIGASHAVSVLTPDDRTERLRNALKIQADDDRSQLAMVRNSYTESASTEEAKEQLVAQLLERQTTLQRVADDLGMAIEVKKFQLNNSDLIRDTAASMHDSNMVRAGVTNAWRTGSTAAHAGRSFAVLRASRANVRRTTGDVSFVELRGDLELDIVPAASAATLALSRAFQLWDLRASTRKA